MCVYVCVCVLLCVMLLYVLLCALYVVIDMLCASRIIFGKISRLEMLFLEFVVGVRTHIDYLTFRLSSYRVRTNTRVARRAS